ncbi:uncharacterized protein LOC123297463 [Chrysoperla carnea]|uniref:uncharacterized protein LOC123297463 n=1 Tax=Chrysoperla carnea TaxID=189513 RepID=UPI001D072900|nr:uncharacterized protein LOC123297463 [Chrysoperla carnea]
MASSRLVHTIFEFITIVAIVNGNLIKFDGQCPFDDMKPLSIDAAEILGGAPLTMTTIAETTPLSGANRTDTTEILEFIKPDIVKVTLICRSKETGQCGKFFLLMRPSHQSGIYKGLYQVAPKTNFAKFKAAFLSFDPVTMKSVGLACHNLPNSKFQIEIVVLSAYTSVYDEATQEEVNKVLKFNNLEFVIPYVKGIEQNNEC